MYEAHNFPRPLQQACRLETTPLCLTLVWYHEKVSFTERWGQCDPIVKKIEYKHSLLQCSFPPNNISQHRFVLKYQQ